MQQYNSHLITGNSGLLTNEHNKRIAITYLLTPVSESDLRKVLAR